MRSKPYILSDFITDLQAVQEKHGDIPVLDGRGSPMFARNLEVVTIDDWSNSTEAHEGGEIPGIGYAVEVGRRY